jgi:hypothetical protein
MALVPVSEEAGRESPKVFPGNRPRIVCPADDGEFRLPAAAAEVFGRTLTFDRERGNLGLWLSANDRVTWTLSVPNAGAYLVFLDYACDSHSAGNSYTFRVGGARLTGRVLATGAWSDYREVLAGPIRLAPGLQRVTLHSAGRLRNCLMDLRTIRFVPLPESNWQR